MTSQQHQAFTELFLANQHRVFRFIVSAVPRWVEAEELFQQTSLTLWQRWDEFDPENDFTPWACGIAMNHLRNHLRKKQNQQLHFSDDLLEQMASLQLEEQSLLDGLHRALADCMEKLPPQQRRLIERCYRPNASIKQVAIEQGQTANSLYKLVRKIRLALYDCITSADT